MRRTSRLAVLVPVLVLSFALALSACDAPRPCTETLTLVATQTEVIGAQHAAPCIVDEDCVLISDDVICDDGVVALDGCGRAVSAAREQEALAAMDALRDEVCAVPSEACQRDADCGGDPPVCVDEVCVLRVD